MSSDLRSLVDDLSTDIDTLTQALEPLLSGPLSATAGKLPLLDKAKLHVLATYALESLVFSAVRLQGHDAKAHPVFDELGRVKAYFAKISEAENAGAGRGARTLDKDAAARFVKHGLAGNERRDRERAERMEKESSSAKRKLEQMGIGTHTRFAAAGKRIRAEEEGAREVKVVSAADAEENEGEDGGEPSAEEGKARNSEQGVSNQEGKRARRAAKKSRRKVRKDEERANEMR